ncbi:MAG: stage III sporulation protein AC [Ruminococcus sp.]|jgi:stage III sporulation protein AC|nr:stage III sporulation protein AC [Ruminococcus sp.]
MDISLIFQIAGIGIIVAVLNILLKKSDKDEYAVMINIAGVVIVLAILANEIAGLFQTIKSVFGF